MQFLYGRTFTVRQCQARVWQSTRRHLNRCYPVGCQPNTTVPLALYQSHGAAKPHALPTAKEREFVRWRPVRRNSLAGCEDEPGR